MKTNKDLIKLYEEQKRLRKELMYAFNGIEADTAEENLKNHNKEIFSFISNTQLTFEEYSKAYSTVYRNFYPLYKIQELTTKGDLVKSTVYEDSIIGLCNNFSRELALAKKIDKKIKLRHNTIKSLMIDLKKCGELAPIIYKEISKHIYYRVEYKLIRNY